MTLFKDAKMSGPMTLFFPSTKRTSVGLEVPGTSKLVRIMVEQPSVSMKHRQGLREHRENRNQEQAFRVAKHHHINFGLSTDLRHLWLPSF